MRRLVATTSAFLRNVRPYTTSVMSARSLKSFIDDETSLKPLFKRLGELNYLQQIYLKAVPSALGKLGQVAALRDGKICIAAKHGAAAAKLKQLAPQIAEKMSQHLQQAIDIQVIVQVDESDAAEKSARKKRTMSPVAIESLSKLAAELPPSALKSEVDILLKRQAPTKSQ